MKAVNNPMPRLAVLVAVLLSGRLAAHAAPFPPTSVAITVPAPNGILATSNILLVTSQTNSTIYQLNSSFVASTYTTLSPDILPTFQGDPVQEIYLAQSNGNGGFTAGDIFAVRGQNVYRIGTAAGAIAGPINTAFNTSPVCAQNNSHVGVVFDNTGTFGYAMIVACGEEGTVKKVDQTGAVTSLATLSSGTIAEGPAVVGTSFVGGLNGFASGSQVFVSQDTAGVDLITGLNPSVHSVVTAIPNPEGLYLVPGGTCNFAGGAYFSVRFPIGGTSGMIDYYPAADFAGLAGNLIVPVEFPDNPGIPPTTSNTIGENVKMVSAATGAITDFDATNLNGWNREGSTFTQCVAVMPIVKLSSASNAPPTSTDFVFGLYPRVDNSFTNPPTGTPYSDSVNTDGAITCPAGSFQATDDRGTCILTPPETTLPIPLSSGAFNAAVCELKHPTGWTFDTWTVAFAGIPTSGSNFASAPFHPSGEIVDPDIECVNLTIQPGTTEVDLTVTDTPPTQPSGGRFTGGGSFFPTGKNDTPSDTATRITHGFELHCGVPSHPNTLEVNWGGDGKGKKNGGENNFHLDNLTKAECIEDPDFNEQHPAAGIDTYEGIGTGEFNNVAGATAHWVFTDAGEPGVNDEIWMEIWDNTGKLVLRIGSFTGSKTALLGPGPLGVLAGVPGTDTGAALDNGNQQAHK